MRDPERRRRYDMFGDDGRGRGEPGGPGEAFGFGDLFDAFFSGGFSAAAPRGTAAGAGRRGVDGARPRRGRVRDDAARSSSCCRVSCDRCDGIGLRARDAPESLRFLRRRRRGPPGAPIDPRPARDRRALRRRVPGPASASRTRARPAAATAGCARPGTSRWRSPPGSTTANGCGSPVVGPSAPRSGVPGDLYVHGARATAPVARTPRLRPAPRAPIAMTQAALGTAIDRRHARWAGARDRPARHAARSPLPAQGPRSARSLQRARARRPARARSTSTSRRS